MKEASHCLRRAFAAAMLLSTLSMVGRPASAQTNAAAPAQLMPPQPAAAQPSLPGAASPSPQKPGSPIVEQIVKSGDPTLTVRKTTATRRATRNSHVAHHSRGRAYGYGELPIERPALAGVELVAPLLPPGEPPHIVVPTPAYPLEAIAASITTPPPPIICHHARHDPYAPDPRLAREQPVECVPDNP